MGMKLIKIISSFIVIPLFSMASLGQVVYNQYSINPIVINPAYSGAKEALSIIASYRQQWTNIDGAPRTLTFSAHSPILASKSSVGLSIVTDKVGALDQTSMFASYSYKIPFEFGNLYAGLSFGGYQLRSNLGGTNLSGVQDPVFNSGELNNWTFNAGFGLFLSDDNYYVGFSIPRMLTNIYADEADIFSISTTTQFYLTGGYVFDLGSSGMFNLKPYALLRLEPNLPYHFDLAVQAYYNNLISLGLQYRLNDATAVLFGLSFNNSIYIDYAFEVPFGSEINASTIGSTHEIVLNYIVPWPKKDAAPGMRFF